MSSPRPAGGPPGRRAGRSSGRRCARPRAPPSRRRGASGRDWCRWSVQDPHRGSGVTVAEILGRQPDRLAAEDAAQQVAERQQTVAQADRADRVAPGSLDVTDDGERPTAGVRQKPLRQGRDERRLGDRHGGLRAVGQEMVGGRRAGAVAGEEERDQAVDSGVVVEVGGRQVMRWLRAASPALASPGRAVPLAAVICISVALGPAQAVRRGEEERRAGPAGSVP